MRQTPTISPDSASHRQAPGMGSGPPMVRAVPPTYLARGTTEGTLMACRMGMLLRGGGQGYGHSPANRGHGDDTCYAIIRAVAVSIAKFFTGPNAPCLVSCSSPSCPLARGHVRMISPSQEAHARVVRAPAQLLTGVKEVVTPLVNPQIARTSDLA